MSEVFNNPQRQTINEVKAERKVRKMYNSLFMNTCLKSFIVHNFDLRFSKKYGFSNYIFVLQNPLFRALSPSE